MRGSTGTARRAVLLGAALGLVLGGCADEPQDAGSVPTGEPTASESASATPQTPEQQVEAAVRAYYAELTRAAQTNDTTRLRQMVTTGCPCFRPIKVIERGAARGESTPDAAWEVRQIRVHDLTPESASVEVRYRVTRYAVLDAAGRVLGRVRAQASHYDLSLIKTPRGWVIGNLFDLERL